MIKQWLRKWLGITNPSPRDLGIVSCDKCSSLGFVGHMQEKKYDSGTTYPNSLYTIYFCPKHKVQWDSRYKYPDLIRGSRYYYRRGNMPCDEHGTPVGYVKANEASHS